MVGFSEDCLANRQNIETLRATGAYIMKLYTLALVAAFSAFGISAEAQTCSTLCDEDFWQHMNYSRSIERLAAEISKADVNARDVRGRTVLGYAARSGTAENVKFLLDAGADASLKNDVGKAAWDYAQEDYEFKNTDAYRLLNEARFR